MKKYTYESAEKVIDAIKALRMAIELNEQFSMIHHIWGTHSRINFRSWDRNEFTLVYRCEGKDLYVALTVIDTAAKAIQPDSCGSMDLGLFLYKYCDGVEVLPTTMSVRIYACPCCEEEHIANELLIVNGTQYCRECWQGLIRPVIDEKCGTLRREWQCEYCTYTGKGCKYD